MDHYSSAFCTFRFSANGGRFSSNGLPIITDEDRDEDGIIISGKCTNPGDCADCGDLHTKALELYQQGWSVDWECDQCIKVTRKSDRLRGVAREMPGVYQTGRNPASIPFPDLPKFDNSEDRPPSVSGCMRCGWQTSFLQLILRRQT